MKALGLRERSAACPFCARERCVFLSPLCSNVVFIARGMNTQAMEQGLREVCRSVRIGKILIQRVSGNVYARSINTRGFDRAS